MVADAPIGSAGRRGVSLLRATLITCFFGLAAVFFYEVFRPTTYYPNVIETSAVRDAKLLESAVLQFQIDRGTLAIGSLPSTTSGAVPICRYRAADESRCFSLDSLVPDYLDNIPTSDSPSGDINFTGFGIYASHGQVRIMSALSANRSNPDSAPQASSVSQGNGEQPCNDLAGAWKFDEKAGDTAFLDASGNGTNGITFPFSAPLGPSNAVPKPLKHDIASWKFGASSVVYLPNASALNITGPLTLSLWINTSWTGTDGARVMLFGGRSEVPPFRGFAIGMDSLGRPSYASNLSPVSSQWIHGEGALNDGRWHHLAVAVTQTGSVTFFRDGVVDTRLDGAPPSEYRGIRAIGAASNGTLSFSGLLDDVRLYRRALSASDVASLAMGTDPACSPPVQHVVSTGSYVCGTCSDRKDRTIDCTCAYEHSTNVIVVKGVSPEPQKLGVTVGCPAGTTIARLSAVYGGNCTERPASCVLRYGCLGEADCPVFFSEDSCFGGAFPKDCPVRDGEVSFFCSD